MAHQASCILVGDIYAEKHSLIETFVKKTFCGYELRDFSFPFINVADIEIDGLLYGLSIFDTTGKEDYDRIRHLYYQNQDVVIACFSVVSPDSFLNIKDKWFPEIKHFFKNAPILLVGTQTELRHDSETICKLAKINQRPVTKEAAIRMARKLSAVKYLECSAPLQEGLKDLFDEAVLAVIAARSKKITIADISVDDVYKEGMREGYVYLTIKKLVLMGPPCVGKTAFKALLFGWPAPKRHHSTAIVSRPIRAIERMTDTGEGKVWDTVESPQILRMIAHAIKGLDEEDVFVFSPESSYPFLTADNSMPLEDAVTTDPAPEVVSDPAKIEVKSTASAQVCQPSHVPADFSVQVKKQLSKKENIKKSKHLHKANWIHVLDSGGQPQFADISRAFLRGNAINVIVFKLTEKLSDKPRFTYSLNGKVINAPSELQMTNIQLIEHFVRSVSASKSSTIKIADQEIVTKPFFIIVGSYYDEVTKGVFKKTEVIEETIADKNRQILSSLSKFRDHMMFYNEASDELIFPVDNLCLWNRKKVSAQLHQLIMAQKDVGFKIPIPVRWYLFELQIKEVTSSSDHGIISLQSCCDIGAQLNMNEEEVKASLLYFDALTLCLYYEKLLPNVIFTNPQYLLDLLSNIVRVSFVSIQEEIIPKGQSLSLDTQRLLREDGIFDESLLDTLGLPFVSPLFTKANFLLLLQHILVITKINSFDSIPRYFMPVVLSTDQLTKEHKQVFSTSIEPLIITFSIKVVPQGLFPTLIVTLLSRKEEPHFFIDSRSDNFPRQLRYAVKLYSEDLFGSVFLCDEYKVIEIHFTGLSEHCYHLRMVILQALLTSATTLAYDVDNMRISALPRCNRKHISSSNDDTPHPISVNNMTIPLVTGCSIEDLPVIKLIDERQICWLNDLHVSRLHSLKTTSDLMELPEQRKLDERHAPAILTKLRDLVEWEYVGTLLGLKNSVLKEIKYNNHHQLQTCRKDMIMTWLHSGTATLHGLISALETVERIDLVHLLKCV